MTIGRKIVQTSSVQVMSIVIGVVTGIFITRMLGPEGRGVYAIFRANVDFFLLFLTFGLSSAITVFTSEKRIEFKKVVGIGLVGWLAGSISILVLFFLIFSYWPTAKSLLFPSSYDGPFFVGYVAISFMIGFLGAICTSMLHGNKHFEDTNRIKLIQALLLLITMIIFYVYVVDLHGIGNIELILKGTLSILIVNALGLMIFWYKRFRDQAGISMDLTSEAKQVFKFVNLVYIAELLNFFNYRLDIWLVEYFANSYQLGLYSLAVNLSQMLLIISTSTSLVLLPFLNQLSTRKDEAQSILRFYMRLTFTLTLGACLIVYLLADTIVPWVYGAEFSESIDALSLLLPGVAFSSLTKLMGVYMIVNKRIRYNIFAVTCGLVITVVLDIMLIPRFGIVGASLATTFSYMTIFLVLFLLVKFKLRLRGFNFFVTTFADASYIYGKLRK